MDGTAVHFLRTRSGRYQAGVPRGVGWRRPDTPQESQGTPVMAKVTTDENGVVNRWNMTTWRFRGDRIVTTQTKSGWGNDAPSSAYR